MLVIADAVAVIAVALVALAAGLIVRAVKVGNVYRPITRPRLEQIVAGLDEPVLYHYMHDQAFGRRVDLNAGTITCRRGKPSAQANIVSLRAIFFYAGHSPAGARSNHARKSRRDGAVVSLDLTTLLDATTPARLWFRRWDQALAVRADYTGPITGYRRGVDILATKTDPHPPELTPVASTTAE